MPDDFWGLVKVLTPSVKTFTSPQKLPILRPARSPGVAVQVAAAGRPVATGVKGFPYISHLSPKARESVSRHGNSLLVAFETMYRSQELIS